MRNWFRPQNLASTKVEETNLFSFRPEFNRHRRWTNLCEDVQKIAEYAWGRVGARSEDKKRRRRKEEKEWRRCRALIFVTMTHRLCIRAGPSTLEAGRITTTTPLPSLHSGSSSFSTDRRPIGLPALRVTEKRDILPLRVEESSPLGMKKKLFS